MPITKAEKWSGKSWKEDSHTGGVSNSAYTNLWIVQAKGTLQGNSDHTKITPTEISATAHHREYRVCNISPAKLNAYFLKNPQKTQTNNKLLKET